MFDAVRPWHARLGGRPTLDRLNALAEEAGVRTALGQAVRFVPPAPADPYYEIKVSESGCVQTRPDSLHDLFNALAWLAFPREQGRRGRLRDLLTIFDEGGAVVSAPPALQDLLKAFGWKDLFWKRRAEVLGSMRVHVLGHAVLEQALEPRPGITCKVIFAPDWKDAAADPDACAEQWLRSLPPQATPRDMPPLPIFGYPGWHAENGSAGFYEDQRYFRPFRRDLPVK